MYLLRAVFLAALTGITWAYDLEKPGGDKYAEERGVTSHDALENNGLHARDAEPASDAMHAWEEAHGGQLVNYELYADEPEVHGHYFETRAVEEAEDETDTAIDETILPRDVPEFDEPDVDTSLEGYGHTLSTRTVPDFEDPGVDTSLTGYDHALPAGSVPDFGGTDIDNSLDGYGIGNNLEARNEPAPRHLLWTGILPTTDLHIPPPTPTYRSATALVTEAPKGSYTRKHGPPADVTMAPKKPQIESGVKHVVREAEPTEGGRD